VAKELEERGYEAEALHGDIPQDRRERILARFRERKMRVLVATDVAARGIDIERLSHVVNWSLPHDPELYVHRVGRTGRAGNAGTALTFVTPDEYRKLFRFKRAAGAGFKKAKVPEIAQIISTKRARARGAVLARAESFGAEALAAEAAGGPGAAEAEGQAGAAGPWLGFADEILARMGPREALAAALFEAYGEEMDVARYREIEESSVDATATARLFIGSGKRDKASPKGLASLVRRLTGLPDRLVGGIEIYENFSFVSVPFEAAERAIAAARREGGLPSVRYATPRGAGPRGVRPGSRPPPGRGQGKK
jgi:ATP-dependent RNA helicase DeaD